MSVTKIPYVDRVWNPIIGCTPASEGCSNCYANRMSVRLQANPKLPNYAGKKFSDVRFVPEALNEPKKWRLSQTVMVCSMGDILHEQVPNAAVEKIIAVMKANPKHTFLVFTKRAIRASLFHFPANVMIGVSIENRDNMSRLESLNDTDCYHKFISFEPLIGDVGPLDLSGIEWVVVGGETGPGARPCDMQWIQNIYLQCKAQDVPYFFKQYGHKSVNPGNANAGSPAFHIKEWPIIDNPPF
jgi:protein gp37